MKFSKKIFKISNQLPKKEDYGLTSRIRRSAVSINSNLMEGYHRNGLKEFRQFIEISKGSAGEL